MAFRFESEQSAFNMAVAYLERINRLLYNAAECKTTRQLKDWFDTVRTIFGEVKIKFKDKEIDDLSFQEEQIVKFFLIHPGINDGDMREFRMGGRSIIRPNYPQEREQLYKMIDIFEFTIKKLADKYGLLLPNRADPRFAVLER